MKNSGGLAGPVPINISIPENPSTGIQAGLQVPDKYTATFAFAPPLNIEPNSYCDLISLSVPYSVPNIVPANVLPGIPNGNNRYSINWAGGGFMDYFLPQGLYSYSDIAYQLNAQAIANNWITAGQTLFSVIGVSATQTLTIIVDPTVLTGGVVPAGGIVISFVNPSPASGLNNSVGELLGYGVVSPGAVLTLTAGSATPKPFPAPGVADFAIVTSYLVYCTAVTDSYSNGSAGQLLYALGLGGTAPNTVISYQASMRYPVPAFPGRHSNISVYFTDNSGNKIPLSLFQGNININFVISKNKIDGSL